ncbi:MAG: coproporphyrinogen III oxidase, partial [Planctomycetota bacterium]
MGVPDWLYSLDRAVALGPEHLSCYALIFEPGTLFFTRRARGAIRAVAEEEELRMFRLTERRLRHAGWRRYEVSNFARPGRRCRHNLRYWRNESYFGYGAGAVSYADGERTRNERNPGRYAEAVFRRGRAVVTRERLRGRDGAAETIFLGLRTAEGVQLRRVGRRYGVDTDREFGGIAARLRRDGLLRAGAPLRLTRRGWRLADAVAGAFL